MYACMRLIVARGTPCQYSSGPVLETNKPSKQQLRTNTIGMPPHLESLFQHKQRKHQMPFPLVRAILLPSSPTLSLFPSQFHLPSRPVCQSWLPLKAPSITPLLRFRIDSVFVSPLPARRQPGLQRQDRGMLSSWCE